MLSILVSDTVIHPPHQHQILSNMPNPSPPVTFTKGKKGVLNAVIDGHRYSRNGKHNNNTYYRCTECKVRVTINEVNELVSQLPEHVHDSREAEIGVTQVKNAITEAAATTDRPTKDIVATSLGTLDFEGMNCLNC